MSPNIRREPDKLDNYNASGSFSSISNPIDAEMARKCPPLGTMWVYTIIQLDLVKAVAALVAVAAYVQWAGLKIIL